MRRSLVSLVLLSTLGFSLVSCSTYIHPAVPIPLTDAAYESDEISIAVDFAGNKYIARTECPTSGIGKCKLVFSKVAPGLAGHAQNLLAILPSSGYFDNVDVAVTDTGLAYFIYRWQNDAMTESYLVYVRSDDIYTGHLIEDTYYVSGKPLVVARGETVYVVYPADDGPYIHVRYRRLNPDMTVGGWVDNTDLMNTGLLDAAVGWNGNLYVLYFRNPHTFYADNVSVIGDMATHFSVGDYTNTSPGIDVNGGFGLAETVYIIYYLYNNSTSDDIYIGHCPAASCMIGSTYSADRIPLVPSDNVKVWGHPRIVADVINTAYYVYAATSIPSPNRNIYVGGFQVGPTFGLMTQLTDSPGSEADPDICLTASVNPVTAWRMDLGTGFYGDIFAYDNIAFLRKARSTNDAYYETEFTCNADWGAGIWNEETAGRKQAWVSFNSYPALLPAIKK